MHEFAFVVIPAIGFAILGFLLWVEKQDRADERKEWAAEREILLERIQRPEVIPQLRPPVNYPAVASDPESDDEPDQYAMVGHVDPTSGEELNA